MAMSLEKTQEVKSGRQEIKQRDLLILIVNEHWLVGCTLIACPYSLYA